jgi:hypothetical protein
MADPKAPTPKTLVTAPSPAVTSEPEPEKQESAGPIVERVNMSGLVIEKTLYPDGECETEVLAQPEIDAALVKATRASQRARGH